MNSKLVQSGTRNTVVQRYNNTYYAVEESCRPMKLKYVNDVIKIDGVSRHIDRMAAHLLDENTIFSYTMFDKYPLLINNSLKVPWFPCKYPGIVHDGVSTHDKKYYIFPLTSTGLGRMNDYLQKKIDLPFDGQLNKAGWLIYDRHNHMCREIYMDEYVDLFHISHIQHMYNNIHKLYVPFIYNFSRWVYDPKVELEIVLKKVYIDLNSFKIVNCVDTKLRMDFVKCIQQYSYWWFFDTVSMCHIL